MSTCKISLFKHVSDAVLSYEIQPAMNGNIAFSLSEEAQALRHILVKYEALIEENPQTQPGLLEQSEQTNPPNRKRSKKKKVKKNKKTSKDNEKKFVPPRPFSLFPKPSLRWRFIKIDSQNLDGIFPGAFFFWKNKMKRLLSNGYKDVSLSTLIFRN
ncbi:uncharacterized protein BX663DRAFT_541169 [Cokeromyces recurvatus]|uniref:uncharacterized protein n=1 Tax=Cokeromyces recurvatus TaxID=90255 RepID=UPI002220E89D|nr:uncharacterized protein BX663DRAFT_541169 [Cokeromyces recurvatus]KAI7905764.1 hypothetical protein BX663DRAFT_541169 [Cokeromyces recurvatus]